MRGCCGACLVVLWVGGSWLLLAMLMLVHLAFFYCCLSVRASARLSSKASSFSTTVLNGATEIIYSEIVLSIRLSRDTYAAWSQFGNTCLLIQALSYSLHFMDFKVGYCCCFLFSVAVAVAVVVVAAHLRSVFQLLLLLRIAG